MLNLNLNCDVKSHINNVIVIQANENTRYLEDEASYIIEKLALDNGAYYRKRDDDTITIYL